MFAIVILNYISSNETIELINSIQVYYPDMRIIVVDNGSPSETTRSLKLRCLKDKKISYHQLENNYGFARGNNFGIEIALSEGYQYIVCSNSDVLFSEKTTIERLKDDIDREKAAIAGPKILNLKGENQNPILINRPNKKIFRKMRRNNSLVWILGRQIKSRFLKKIIKHFFDTEPYEKRSKKITSKLVYALHGAFIMFGPLFFKHYKGFNPDTFLYAEEYILAEMLLAKKLTAFFDSTVEILHKEDRTTNLLWKNQQSLRPQLYTRNSFKIYKKWWKNNNKLLKKRDDE